MRTEHLHNVRDFFTWAADNPENPVAVIKIKIGFGNTQMIGKYLKDILRCLLCINICPEYFNHCVKNVSLF